MTLSITRYHRSLWCYALVCIWNICGHALEQRLGHPPTFALTYAGTWATLVKNCGFSEQLAKEIEANYHELYKESDAWAKEKLDLCCQQGYIDVAFGLRIRTPLLARSVLDNSKTLREAQAEARSVGALESCLSFGWVFLIALTSFTLFTSTGNLK